MELGHFSPENTGRIAEEPPDSSYVRGHEERRSCVRAAKQGEERGINPTILRSKKNAKEERRREERSRTCRPGVLRVVPQRTRRSVSCSSGIITSWFPSVIQRTRRSVSYSSGIVTSWFPPVLQRTAVLPAVLRESLCHGTLRSFRELQFRKVFFGNYYVMVSIYSSENGRSANCSSGIITSWLSVQSRTAVRPAVLRDRTQNEWVVPMSGHAARMHIFAMVSIARRG